MKAAHTRPTGVGPVRKQYGGLSRTIDANLTVTVGVGHAGGLGLDARNAEQHKRGILHHHGLRRPAVGVYLASVASLPIDLLHLGSEVNVVR